MSLPQCTPRESESPQGFSIRSAPNTLQFPRRVRSDDRGVVNSRTSNSHERSRHALNHRHEFDDLLWARTQVVAAPEVDFDELRHVSLEQWDPRAGRRDNHQGFRIFTRQVITPGIPRSTEVLATGALQCTLAEAAAVLRCPDQDSFNTSMSNIHGWSFQHGSIIHTFNLPTNEPLALYRCVKTISFARSRFNVFGHDEYWCFLEEFTPTMTSDSSRNGFTLSQRSLPPASLPPVVRPPIELVRRRYRLRFRRSNKRVHDLIGMSIGFSVDVIPDRQPAAVAVVFYGHCPVEDTPSVIHRRMLKLARGVLKLPEIIARYRQSLIDSRCIERLTTKTSTTRCVNCSRKFHRILVTVKKTPCYLCADLVCSRCGIRQPLEATGRDIAILVCPHCLDGIRNCTSAASISSRVSCSNLSTSSHTSLPAREVFFCAAQVLPDPDDAPEPGQAVISYLEEVLGRHSIPDSAEDLDVRAQVAINVTQQLIGALDEGIDRVMAYTSDSEATGSSKIESEPKATSALQTLRTQFTREALPPSACVLSNIVTRAYPIDTSIRRGPIPPNEAHRLESIARINFLAARGADELNFICELATCELSCMASLLSIVGSAHQYVFATDWQMFKGAEIPREHTICQYLIMGDRPMLVQHPESDPRLSNLPMVVDHGIQFYVGFPIFSQDGYSVVGTLSCIDICPRDLTQSQYSTLLHLTRTACRIIWSKGSGPRRLQRLRKRK